MGTTFGNWLKQRRKELGVAQEELAERIGCSETMLWKIEAGQRHPSSQIAHLLADYFRVPADEHEAFVAFARADETARGSGIRDQGSVTTEVSPQPSQHAPWREVYIHKTNLPTSLTPIIGREREVAEACARLVDPKTHLVTMVGAPGIGKTRLAIAVAAELLEHFEDGIYFVDLAPLGQPGLVLPTVARALGLADEGRAGTPVERLLLGHLRDKRLLLVLDNFEQVLDAGFQLVALLEGCPWLKVLVTSRETLHVKGERRFPVPPLPLPHLESLPPLHQLALLPSVELFVERAQMSEPDFSLDEQNASTVAGICVHLDGLPLAIELAAGQTGFLSPHEISDRLTSRLQLLKARERYLPERQRTLRGAVDSSYNLLGEQEQTLFNRLGVFAGGFTVEAAMAVCGDPDVISSPTFEVTEGLQSLLDKSLITQTQSARGERRLGMLETIREYALDQLHRSADATKIRTLHAEYYLSFAQEVASHLSGPDQRVQFDKLEGVHDNVVASLEWLFGDGYEPESVIGAEGTQVSVDFERVESGAKLCVALFQFWTVRGYYKEARTWFKKAIERIEECIDPAYQIDSEPVARGVQAPVDLATAQKISPTLLSLLGTMFSGAGIFAYEQSDFDEAIALHEASLAIRRHLEDKWGISSTLSNLGNVAKDEGDYTAGKEYYSESLSLARELESESKILTCLNNMGNLEVDIGNFAQGRILYDESLAIAEKMENKEEMGRTLNNLGIVARYQGEYAQARRFLERASTLQRELGYTHGNGLTLVNLGYLARDEGAYDEARAGFLEGLTTVWKVGDSRIAVECMEGLASIATVAGDTERAARLFGSAEALREAIKAPIAPAERTYHASYVGQARAQLSDSAWEAAWAEGRAMTAEEAVAYAFETARREPRPRRTGVQSVSSGRS